jgi:hypothetical protein
LLGLNNPTTSSRLAAEVNGGGTNRGIVPLSGGQDMNIVRGGHQMLDGDAIPVGTFSGGDEIPAGTFHGGDTIPAGTFHQQ